MKTAFLLFPNCLFRDINPLKTCDTVFFVEEFLFFRLYKFHKQKLVFHRASMKAYAEYLEENNLSLSYISSTEKLSDVRLLIADLAAKNFDRVLIYDPTDNWLKKRIEKSCLKFNIKSEILDSPLFINSVDELQAYLSGNRKYFQTDFYIYQRKKRKILVDDALAPINGKWSFDAENRKKYPAGKSAPQMPEHEIGKCYIEARAYVERNFSVNPGSLVEDYSYPVNHQQAEQALESFLIHRFREFGDFEDAIVKDETFLHHSVLSPLINTGLLLPGEVIRKAIEFSSVNKIPFNSVEGFIRQILGWREFIRMVYLNEGSFQRTRNFWGFKRKIPASFYTGKTGIEPLDATISKLCKTAYNHHIERLMLISNFMLLCEFDPDEVYRWFMEMYIDSYDWVMVPNIYGMGQFADGGLMCTKPYISGSNYILKMSNYKKNEEWTAIWDALFWRFMHVHRSFFLKNPRLGMLIKTFEKWPASKKQAVLTKAEDYLQLLDKEINKMIK